MPFYNYYCPMCDKIREIVKPITKSDNDEVCIECNSLMLKMIGTPTLRFSGGGWSKDGYSKKPPKEKKEDG